jgi:hypothetical protein
MQIVLKALFLKKSRPEKGYDGRPRPSSTLDYITIDDKLAREFFVNTSITLVPRGAIMGDRRGDRPQDNRRDQWSRTAANLRDR